MSSDILLRFALAIGIIFLGVGLNWLFNRSLIARAKGGIGSLFSTPPNKPTIVYFTTPDCAPCKTVQRPALEKLISLLGEKLHVIEIDATQQPEVAKTWGVDERPDYVFAQFPRRGVLCQ